jgi:hypothetical protein
MIVSFPEGGKLVSQLNMFNLKLDELPHNQVPFLSGSQHPNAVLLLWIFEGGFAVQLELGLWLVVEKMSFLQLLG